MNALERRVAQVAARMTAQELAAIWARAYVAGEEPVATVPPERVPAGERAAYEELAGRIVAVNDDVYSRLSMHQAWLLHLDSVLAWWESLAAAHARIALLMEALAREGVDVRERPGRARKGRRVLVVEPLPACEEGLTPELEPIYGVLVGEDFRAGPPSGAELPAALGRLVAEGLECRSGDLATFEEELAGLQEELPDAPVVHGQLRRALDAHAAKLAQMRARAAAVGGAS